MLNSLMYKIAKSCLPKEDTANVMIVDSIMLYTPRDRMDSEVQFWNATESAKATFGNGALKDSWLYNEPSYLVFGRCQTSEAEHSLSYVNGNGAITITGNDLGDMVRKVDGRLQYNGNPFIIVEQDGKSELSDISFDMVERNYATQVLNLLNHLNYRVKAKNSKRTAVKPKTLIELAQSGKKVKVF